jgi:hypothetical protein
LKLLILLAVVVTGKLENPRLTESSGIAASRRNPGLYWTQNDSGNPPEIFLIDRAGRDLGVWTVDGAANVDWEDIAVGPDQTIYIGDIGDNQRSRQEVVVYRVPEPVAKAGGGATAKATALHFRYPDGPHDAEALLVQPRTGDIYIVTKAKEGDLDTLVFKAPATGSGILKRVGKLDLPPEFDLAAVTGRITGGSISPDGKRVVLCDYVRAYEYVLPAGRVFDDIWRQNPEVIDPGPRLQGESVTYSLDGESLLFTSEGKHSPVVEVDRK